MHTPPNDVYTAGQERFKAITSAHYRKSLGALLVYDITKEKSFKNVETWLTEVKEHAEPDIVLMLVGTKLDICQRDPSKREVSTGRAEEFARLHNLLFIETSAFTDTNVRDSFETLVQEIYNVRSQEEIEKRMNPTEGNQRLVFTDVDLGGPKS